MLPLSRSSGAAHTARGKIYITGQEGTTLMMRIFRYIDDPEASARVVIKEITQRCDSPL